MEENQNPNPAPVAPTPAPEVAAEYVVLLPTEEAGVYSAKRFAKKSDVEKLAADFPDGTVIVKGKPVTPKKVVVVKL